MYSRVIVYSNNDLALCVGGRWVTFLMLKWSYLSDGRQVQSAACFSVLVIWDLLFALGSRLWERVRTLL